MSRRQHTPVSVTPPLGWFGGLLVVGSILIVCALLAGTAYDRWRSYRETEMLTTRNMENLARTLEEHAVRTITSADLVISAIAKGLSGDLMAPLDPTLLVNLLHETGPSTELFRSTFVLDKDGRSRYATNDPVLGKSFADREYFAFHRDHPEAGLHVSPPLVTRGKPQSWVIVLTRRISDPYGGFAGVVARALELSYFEKFYSNIAPGAHGNVTLWTAAGDEVLARYPRDEGLLGRRFPGNLSDLLASGQSQGTFRSISPIDGIERMVSYRSLSGTPLVVSVGFAPIDYQTSWRADTMRYGAAALLLAAVIATLTVVLLRAFAQREAIGERFRDFADSASDWFWETDAEHRFSTFSERQRKLYGVERANVIGQSRWDFSNTFPEDKEVFTALRAEHDARRPFRNVTYRYRTQIGVRVVRISGKPVFARDGRFLGYRGIGSDVTDEVRREEELSHNRRLLQVVVDQIPARISVKDTELRYVLLNRAQAERFGGRLEGSIGKRLEDLTEINIAESETEAFRASVNARDLAVIATGQPSMNVAETLTADDGHIESWLTSKAPISDAAGKVTGILTVAFDITELKRTERELRQAREAAEMANQAKSQFLANMSHELRTPLNAIMGFSDMMANELLGPIGNPRYRDYLRDIHDSGRHLLAIINDILDLAKVESGKLELVEEYVDLGEVIDACIRLMRERARNANLRLDATIEPGLPRVLVDHIRLKQIVLNLLSNAVKFTPAGGSGAIAATREADGGVAIVVRDTGIGMDADELAMAMEPFRQVDNAYTRSQGGTGLGLPLTKALVELHGGSFAIDSRKSVGTRITVRLPARRVEHAGAAAPRQRAAEG